jgi:O-antigen/teichoic acid export membrane protein
MNQIWKSKKAAIALSYIGVLAQTLGTIILTRLYLRRLGADAYGLYQMVYSVAQYILILDLGISTTMIRFIAEFDTKKDTVKKENFAFHFLLIVICLCVVIAGVGIVVNANIENIYRTLTPEEYLLAHQMFLLMIVQIMLTVVGHYFKGIAMANEQYTLIKLLGVLDTVINIALVVTFLNIGFGVMGIVYAKSIVIIIQLLVPAIVDFTSLKFKIKFHYWDFPMLKPAFALMIAMLLQSIVGYVNNSVDKTILGIMTTKVDVAIYSIAATFITMFNTLPTSISSVFQTKATKIVVAGVSRDELTDFVVRPGRFQFMITAGFIAGFFLFGKDFIICWAGENMSAAWLYAMLIMIPNMIPLVQNTCLSILNAMDKRLFRSLILVAITVLNIGMTVFFIGIIGPIGAPLATGISYIIGHIILMNIYYQKKIHLNVFGMFKQIFSKIWICVLIALILNAPLMLWQVNHNWGVLAVKAIAFLLVYGIAVWVYGFNKSEKQMVASALARLHIRVPVK